MPTYSQGQRLLKGAIDPAASERSTIVLQYNPETVKRSLEPPLSSAPGLAPKVTGLGRCIAAPEHDRKPGSGPTAGQAQAILSPQAFALIRLAARKTSAGGIMMPCELTVPESSRRLTLQRQDPSTSS